MRHAFRILALVALLAVPAPGHAAEPTLGKVTDLPLPRYVSLKTDEANVRRGPATEHRVDWQFVRRGMPMRVVAEYGPWRRVQDMDDVVGWVHSALLSSTRTVVVTVSPDMLLHDAPDPDARATARIEQGVILRLLACAKDWCRLEKDGHRGWAPKADLWGVDDDEVFD
ncbi:MAG: SH3-like domain-containing protein [Paracoccaceae bacterium]|jgi:SH3-like domain-containing protein